MYNIIDSRIVYLTFFKTNLADEEIYKGKKFLFPVEVKIKTVIKNFRKI